MADPLSITASIITVLQLAGSVASFFLSCRDAAKGEDGIVQKLLRELQGLTNVLEPLEKLATQHGNGTHSLEAFSTLSGPLNDCKGVLEKLDNELKSVTGAQGLLKLRKIMTWPFKEKDVQSSLKLLNGRKSTLALALQNIQMYSGPPRESHFVAESS